jgi:transcription elongation factor GreA
MSDEIILTRSSFEQMREELRILKSEKMAEITEAIKKARAYGDLSENFEYQTARRDQAILNGKIADIERTLELAKVVEAAATPAGEVGLESRVVVNDIDEDEEWELQIVDARQADPANDKVSIQSPVGQALLGRRVGDTVEVKTPGGTQRYEILRVE